MSKKLLIATISLLVLGTVALLVGFYMSGWSIIDWIKSPYATTFFIVLAFGIIILINIIVLYRNGNKWKD